jgi:hypothetical protein
MTLFGHKTQRACKALVCVALVACGTRSPDIANHGDRRADGIPPWPLAVDAGLDASCRPDILLRHAFLAWSGEVCGIVTPSSTPDQRAATWRCVDAARRAAQPFLFYRIETLRSEGGFGGGYIGVPRAGTIDVYRINYMADPCNDTAGCPARGGTEIVKCTKFFPICQRLDCLECDGQHVVTACRADGSKP